MPGMGDVLPFGIGIGLVCLALLVAIASSRLGERTGVPTPALFLVAAAVASDLVPALVPRDIEAVQRVVTVALVLILFNGGMDIGWHRFHRNAVAIVWIGVAGTAVSALALAAIAHYLLGFDWMLALLLGTALSPTDPAVVFSVLGRREIAGRSGTLLEGESGANDPVGIALMLVLLSLARTGSAGSASGAGVGHEVLSGVGEFALEMGVGVVGGALGGVAMVWMMRRVALPAESLYPIGMMAAAGVVYGAATVAHGSGYLAVFVAGIVAGDARAPYKQQIERFHSALASLAEMTAFVALGLTVTVGSVLQDWAWLKGLVLAVLLAFVVRPVLVGLLLLPLRLRRSERWFVMLAGLKGAVPVLLGTYILTSGRAHAELAYDVVFVVVLFSVVVQGGLVPAMTRWLRLPVHVREPEPWSLGLRVESEPEGVRRWSVVAGSVADGSTIDDLSLGENVWISLVEREGRLLQVRGETELQAGDGVVALVEPRESAAVARLFCETAVPE
jgi:potassium/hydrogen antiporter